MTSLIHSRVDAALRALISGLDYDLHKSIECDEETSKDGYPDLVDEFVETYYAEDKPVSKPETPEQRKALGHKDACYERHMLAPGIHMDVPHLHERIDLQ